MLTELQGFLPAFIIVAVLLTVVFSQLVKKLDKKDKFKGFRVWLPLVFSGLFTSALTFGNFFSWRESPFWWGAIFGFSVFFYEAIVKHLKKIGDSAQSIEG